MKKAITFFALLMTTSLIVKAQTKDTVTIELARTSKIVFTMEDRKDLEQLKHYDFQALFEDMLLQLENGKTPSSDSMQMMDPPVFADQNIPEEFETDEDEDEDFDFDFDFEEDCEDVKYYCGNGYKKVWHSFDFDFGINNYLEDGKFPDYSGAQYTVRPWGSWYVGLNSILHTDVSPSFYVEWGFGVSWYNFKFQEDNTLVTKTPTETSFTPDERNLAFEKSKLSATYLNVSIIPMYAFGASKRGDDWSHRNHNNFRIGIGPYMGYRIESHSKLVYDDGGDKNKDKNKDNFYLNNFRYGLKLKFGTRGVEFFTAYDLNPLFADGKGPDLHAITFGLVF